MTISSKISEVFGSDIEHLHGNLFRVRRSRIKLAGQGLSVDEEGNLVYGNPRWFTNNKGNKEARGLEKSKMEELKNSIQDEGLENPIRCRIIEDGKKSHLQVINGERRFSSVNSLCENDLPCYDPATNSQVPASELYEWIEARVEFMDDEMALRCALKPNETSEQIGDLANVYVVKTLRDSGFDDQAIMRATGKSISWVRETERIMKLDEVCLENFETQKINRKVALQLSLIENAEERIDLLEQVLSAAEVRHAKKIEEVARKKKKADETAEIEQATAELAKKMGDEETASEHTEKSKKAKKRSESSDKEHKKLISEGATATSKDFEEVGGAKPLSHKKIQSEYVDYIESIIEADGMAEDGTSMGLNVEMLRSVFGILQAIMEGNKEAYSVLLENCPDLEAELSTEETSVDEVDDEEDEGEEEADEDISDIGDVDDEASIEDEIYPEDEHEFADVGEDDDDE